MSNTVNANTTGTTLSTTDEAILRLHSKLDIVSLLEEFSGWVSASIGLSGIHYRHPTLGLFEIVTAPGPEPAHECSPHTLGKLGKLYFLSNVSFSALQRQALTEYVDILRPSLSNAVLYQSAVRYCDSLTHRLKLSETTCSSLNTIDSKGQYQALDQLFSNNELHHALSNDALSVFYQPKIDLKSGEVRGVEALLRWYHADQGMLSPEQFIPMAERNGLIQAITRWVLNAVMRQCALWQQLGLLLPVAVNLSGLDLEDATLPDFLAQLLEAWEIPAEFLELEITETAAIADQQRGIDILQRISDIGIAIAIDDFGIGYSSLHRLKHLPVNTIKIDKSFVMEEGRSENDLLFVDTIAHLGHQLGMKVIAEGVDSYESWQRLLATGCDMAQGYHISHPLSSEAITGWLRDTARQAQAVLIH